MNIPDYSSGPTGTNGSSTSPGPFPNVATAPAAVSAQYWSARIARYVLLAIMVLGLATLAVLLVRALAHFPTYLQDLLMTLVLVRASLAMLKRIV